MAWAAALGSVIGSGSEGMASAAQYQASKHERNISAKKQLAMDLVRPSHVVEGLRRAGLNPILAATQGMPGAPHVGMASTGGSPSFDKDSVSKAISSAKAARAMNAELEILEQRRFQERERSRQEVTATNAAERFSEAKARAETMAAQEMVLNLVAQRGLTSARTAESEQTKQRIAVDRMLMEMGVPGARAMEELYTKYPWLRQVQGAMGGGLGSMGAGAVGGTAGYLFHRGASRAKGSMENFGSLVPGKPKRRKR